MSPMSRPYSCVSSSLLVALVHVVTKHVRATDVSSSVSSRPTLEADAPEAAVYYSLSTC